MNSRLQKDISKDNFLSYCKDNPSCEESPMRFAEQLVKEVVGNINKEAFMPARKVSECRSVQIPKVPRDGNADMDPRLKCWKKMLQQRKNIQERICIRTGKRVEDILFNRHVTIDTQSKQMLLRVLEIAERDDCSADPRPHSMLKMRQDPETCREIMELHETVPKLPVLEFVGLPEISKLELASTMRPSGALWLQAKELANKIEKHQCVIQRIMDFCPRVEKLQVAPGYRAELEPIVDTEFLGEDLLANISRTTSESTESTIVEPTVKKLPPGTLRPSESIRGNKRKVNTKYMFGINSKAFDFSDNSSVICGDVQLYFQCDPYQRVRKTIVHLMNFGNKFLQFKWHLFGLQAKDLPQQMATQLEFMFDWRPFVLLPGQQHRIDVMYQPAAVGIKKQHWTLEIQRSKVTAKRHLYVSFQGTCSEPVSYRERLIRQERHLIDNRHRQLTERLAKMHAELAPCVVTPNLDCPYERSLDEREIFSAQNPGFRADRFADLETLKELYALVKKPRQPKWDFSLQTIRECINHHEAAQRASLQKLLTAIVETIRCDSHEMYTKLDSNPERDRSRFVYVRGIVCSALEEWEMLAETLELQFYKSEMQRYLHDVKQTKPTVRNSTKMLVAQFLKKVKSSKYFKDALYIQTYTLCCDAAENIVSAIESTVHV